MNLDALKLYFNPEFGQELKVMSFQDVQNLLGVSTPKNVMLKNLSQGVDYYVHENDILLPLTTVIALVHSSRMENKADVKFEIMAELYSTHNILTGKAIASLEEKIAELYEAYVNNNEQIERIMGASLEKLFHVTYNALNYATVNSTNTEPTETNSTEETI